MLNLSSPAMWLLGSATAAVIATNLAGLLGRQTDNLRRAGWQIVAWVGAALFFVLLPLLSWREGILSPFYLGIASLDWGPSLLHGAPAAMMITAVLLAAWLFYRRTLPRPAIPLSHPESRMIAVLRVPLDVALQQWHWAFYRALAIAWVAAWPSLALPGGQPFHLGFATDPLYWGSWLGLAVAGAEWLLNPFARAALRRSGSREASLRQAALAVATTALFAATRNLWLCLACHMAVEITVTTWLPLAPGESP
ncbi:MAG: hypothetical protein ACUVS6_12625 [Anaerolineae bacterium]